MLSDDSVNRVPPDAPSLGLCGPRGVGAPLGIGPGGPLYFVPPPLEIGLGTQTPSSLCSVSWIPRSLILKVFSPRPSDWHVFLRALPTGRRPAGADPAGQGPGIAPEPWIMAEPSPGVCRRENSSATGTEAF
ncbi:unnamed protein product [Arctogadus glacialis]